MKATLKQLLTRIEDWCDAHALVTEFGHGELPDLEEGKKRTNWTLVYIVVQDPQINSYGVNFPLDFIVCAPTKANPRSKEKDLESLKQVQSDTLQIVQDFIAELKNGNSFFWYNGEPLFEIEQGQQVSALPFIEDHAQWVTGFNAQITIQAADPLNQCDVPYNSEYTDPEEPTECNLRVSNSDDSYAVFIDDDLELPDSTLTINSAAFTDLPATTDLDIEVVNAADGVTPIGSLIDGKWQVDVGVGDDGTVEIRDSAGTLLYSVPVSPGATATQAISDSTLNLRQSDGTTLIRAVTLLAEETKDETIGVSTVNIRKSGGALISSETPEAEESIDYNVADSAISVNSTPFADVEATDSLDIEVVDSSDGTTQVGALNLGKWEVDFPAFVLQDIYIKDDVGDELLTVPAIEVTWNAAESRYEIQPDLPYVTQTELLNDSRNFAANQGGTEVAITSTSNAVSLTLSDSNYFYHLLTENTTLSVVGADEATTILLYCKQPASPFTFAFDASCGEVKGEAVPVDANAKFLVEIVTWEDGTRVTHVSKMSA